MVDCLTGLRRLVDRDAIHKAAWARNVVAGAVLELKYSLVLIPSNAISSRSFRLATVREWQTPSETTRRFRVSQPGVSVQ
jgi:hypothetical protein